jgi:hypothetical protein
MPVSLFGSGFLGATGVTVDGAPVAFTIVSDVRITFVMPAGTDGAVIDVVVAAAGESTTLADAFTYVAPVTVPADAATGTVFTTTAGVVVNVPPQGVAGSLVLTLTPSSPQPGLPGDVLLHSFVLEATLNGAPLASLTMPVTISLPVDPSVVPAGQRPWLYAWTTDGGRPTAIGEPVRRAAQDRRAAGGGRWTLVPKQTYDAGSGMITVAVKPMSLYALSTVRVWTNRFPWIR